MLKAGVRSSAVTRLKMSPSGHGLMCLMDPGGLKRLMIDWTYLRKAATKLPATTTKVTILSWCPMVLLTMEMLMLLPAQAHLLQMVMEVWSSVLIIK